MFKFFISRRSYEKFYPVRVCLLILGIVAFIACDKQKNVTEPIKPSETSEGTKVSFTGKIAYRNEKKELITLESWDKPKEIYLPKKATPPLPKTDVECYSPWMWTVFDGFVYIYGGSYVTFTDWHNYFVCNDPNYNTWAVYPHFFIYDNIGTFNFKDRAYGNFTVGTSSCNLDAATSPWTTHSSYYEGWRAGGQSWFTWWIPGGVPNCSNDEYIWYPSVEFDLRDVDPSYALGLYVAQLGLLGDM